MNRYLRAAVRVVIPFLVAFLVIQGEGLFAALVRSRPGVLPVAMAALLWALLYAPIRHWLIVTLCFGISLLALYDMRRGVPLPAEFDFVWVERLYPVVWVLLASLAALAGVVEAFRPDSVWARRCYFGAAAIYFGGHGLFGYVRTHNWASLILAATGVVAAIGSVYAHRIVAAESDPEPMDEDLRAQAEREEQRAAALAKREWRDTPDEPPKAEKAPGDHSADKYSTIRTELPL